MTTRIGDESGMGLVELLVALMILNIGILAIIAAFSSGMLALRDASRKATAATIADVQMERHRAITFGAIVLDPVTVSGADATYSTDAAWSATQEESAACTVNATTGAPYECNASRTISNTTAPPSPDGRTYRIDTYIVSEKPTNAGSPIAEACDVKLVTVVVRDPSDSMRELTRQSSVFDRSTGLSPGDEMGCP